MGDKGTDEHTCPPGVDKSGLLQTALGSGSLASFKSYCQATGSARGKYFPLVWIGISVLIAIADHYTDPFIEFPILFLIPIILATTYNGLAWGLFLSVLLPLVRLDFEFDSNFSASVQEAVNTGIDIFVFIGITILINTILLQRRALAEEVRVLRGLLPICSHCKKIRSENNDWEQLEAYISKHSEARFSHGFCPDCVAKHYPGLGIKLTKPQ